jgi:predicted transcriptional regulator
MEFLIKNNAREIYFVFNLVEYCSKFSSILNKNIIIFKEDEIIGELNIKLNEYNIQKLKVFHNKDPFQ